MSARLRLALATSFTLNAALVITGRYRLSYDAYIHMFFAGHYARNWWSLWEPRWYSGFPVVSYPPLVHQTIALVSHGLGIEPAFALVFLAILVCFPVGVYLFARIFVGRSSAEYAALAGAVLPAVYYSGHTFGQLPTLFSLLFALFCMAALAQFLRKGDWRDAALAVALVATVAASHHATLLFLPPAVGAMSLHFWLNRQVELRPLLVRLAIFGFPAAVAILLVIWPFWQWGQTQAIQTPIEHPSRHNFIQDPLAAASFFYPMYGPLLLAIPWALWRTSGKRLFAPGLLFSFFFLLGLGDTTPLPRLLFGAGWAWLTYDRFALWANTVLLVFFGQGMVLIERRLRVTRRGRHALIRRWLESLIIIVLGSICLLDALIPSILPTQPTQLDLRPIARFLAANNPPGWYYLTFGLGDQLEALSRMTPSRTLDGGYHTARGLPELRSSGLAQLDSSFWFPNGLAKLDQILDPLSNRGVRWAFVYRKDYAQLLRLHNWIYLTTLSNGVQVWDYPEAQVPIAPQSPPEPPLEQFSWGVLPMAALIASAMLALARLRPARARVLFEGLYFLGIGLLPLTLSLWYFRPLSQGRDPRVYFTYADAIFYLSDGLILFCVACWGLGKIDPPAGGGPDTKVAASKLGNWLVVLLLALAAWSTLSILWSIDRWLSAAFAAQLWLILGLFQSLRQRPQAWRYLTWGCAAALCLQLVLAAGQLAWSSTALASGLHLIWPGSLTSATPGASVVQLRDGARWLRLYGSLPHPNLLGGLLLLLLAGPAHLVLQRRRGSVAALLLFAGGVGALVLTFSRSAWLGFTAAAILLLLRRSYFDRRRLAILGLGALVGGLTALIPLRAFLGTRLAGIAGAQLFDAEVTSVVTRYYLIIEAQRLIQQNPLLGTGAGTFAAALSRMLPPYFKIEPVHNILLLAWSELGPTGLILSLAGAIITLLAIWRARTVAGIIAGGLLLGLLIISLFDHYPWTLSPMRAVFWLAAGMLISQEEHG